MPDTVPVLFIAGTGRSGSTLLANTIGSLPGAVSVGEVRHVWERGIRQSWDCGCGASFGTCPFWQEVMATAFPHGVDVQRLLDSDRALLRLRASRRAIAWSREPDKLLRDHGYYLDALARLYPAMQSVSGAELLVDSSKTASYASILAATPGLDLRLLHLVRDPRAAAYSWLSPKASPDRPGTSSMDRLGAAKSAALWVLWNRSVESLMSANPHLPGLRLTYEEFVTKPAATLRQVVDRLCPELGTEQLPVVGQDVLLVTSHTVSGNADRMRRGQVRLNPDERWKEGLGAHNQLAVLAIGAPSMRRYGYGIRISG